MFKTNLIPSSGSFGDLSQAATGVRHAAVQTDELVSPADDTSAPRRSAAASPVVANVLTRRSAASGARKRDGAQLAGGRPRGHQLAAAPLAPATTRPSSPPPGDRPASPAGGRPVALATATDVERPQPRGPHPLSSQEHQTLAEAFAAALPSFFGSDLSYAFICGSVARGHAIRADDIDTFIVLKKDSPLGVDRYTTWLKGLHMQMGMQVDTAYPHEIVTRAQLEEDVFAHLDATRLSLHFNSSALFDRVTWAEMISSHQVGFVGSRQAYEADRARCSPHVARWLRGLHAALRDGGDMADKARRYARAQEDGPAGGADFGPGFAWEDLSIYSLPRLMRRVVPLADSPPPAGTSDVVEACMNLPVLHTPRLSLRPLQAGDGAALFDLCSRPEVACFTSWEAWKSPAQADAFIAHQAKQAAAGRWSPWAICLADSQTLIGTVTFTDYDEEARSAEIGFIMHPDHQRQGFTHEAAARVIAFGREDLGLHRLAANCEEENVPCQSLLLKLGLRFEARLPDRAYKRRGFRNLVTFATLFPDLNPGAPAGS